MTRAQLQKLVQDPDTVMIEIEIAAVMVAAARTGDHTKLSFLLDRAIGKPTEAVAEEDEAAKELARLSDEELLARVKAQISA